MESTGFLIAANMPQKQSCKIWQLMQTDRAQISAVAIQEKNGGMDEGADQSNLILYSGCYLFFLSS